MPKANNWPQMSALQNVTKKNVAVSKIQKDRILTLISSFFFLVFKDESFGPCEFLEKGTL